MSHHILLLHSLAAVEFLSLASHANLMNIASVDQSLGSREREIRKCDFYGLAESEL